MNPTPMNVRRAAQAATRSAINRGDIVQPETCDKCSEEKPVVPHHPNYKDPLRIKWLCGSCHKRTHIAAGEVNSRVQGGGAVRLKVKHKMPRIKSALKNGGKTKVRK